MNTWEEVMNQPYYSAETLEKLTDGMTDFMKTAHPDDKSVFHFFVAAAHASDICETIRNKRKPDFDLLPYDGIESDIANAFNLWKLRDMFFSEDEQGNAAPNPVMMLGNLAAMPISSEKTKEGQSQLVKKASSFFLFYFWNLFHQKIGDNYEMSFSVNSIMIPMLHDFAFTQLGINIKSKDNSAVQHYFDALKFGEDVCDMSEADIYFAIKDTLNGFGIPELHVPAPEKYDERRFKVYKDELIGYVPIGGETRVSVPEGIKSIKNGVFRGIAGITTIDLPDSLEELKPTALCYMPDLTEVNVSHNLKYIDGFAFMNSKIVNECDNSMLIIGGWLVKCDLTDEVIRIPENVVGICYTAFDDTEKTAKEIILPPRIKTIYDETFDDFIQLEKINLPEGLQEIGSQAFNECESLKEIIMPDTITSLDAGAFQGCCALKKVRLSDNIVDIKECTFVDCENLEELHLPANLKSIGKDGINAFAGCASLKKIVFPEHLEYIGECSFQDCEELEEIILPDSIKTIDNMAFAGCTKLKKVHLPDHEIDIAENAFEGTPWENEQ